MPMAESGHAKFRDKMSLSVAPMRPVFQLGANTDGFHAIS